MLKFPDNKLFRLQKQSVYQKEVVILESQLANNSLDLYTVNTLESRVGCYRSTSQSPLINPSCHWELTALNDDGMAYLIFLLR